MLKPLKVKTLLNPCCMNMNVSSYDPRNINPDVKFGENPLDYYQYYWQWLQLRERQNVHFHHSAEFQRNFKKSKISESMTEYSTSRMSNSSPSRSKQARPTKDHRQACLKFRRGNCNYGDKCIFAHDETGDARISLYPKRGGIVAEEQHSMVGGDRLCKYLMSGISCPYGDSCYFNHHIAENVKGGSGAHHRENTSITVVNSRDGEEYKKGLDGMKRAGVENLNSDASQMQQYNMLWKTRLCRKWETLGCCPYGIKCHYAHGETDLRKLGSFNQDSENFFRVGNVTVDRENAASTQKAIRISFKRQEKSKKCLDKWNSVAKINCIYADWIESSPPVRVISGIQ